MSSFKISKTIPLLAGDLVTFALVTLFGFATHNELASAEIRMLSTFIPLLVSWFLISPHLRVYDLQLALDWRQLWRPFWAMVLAAPMAGWLRGLWLGAPVVLIFVFIIGGVSALAILAWRSLYLAFYTLAYRKKLNYG